MKVGQSSTHCRLYGEQEDAFQRLTLGPSRLLRRELLEAHQVGCQAAHVGIMFSCGLETSSSLQFYHLGLFASAVHSLWAKESLLVSCAFQFLF